MKREGAAALASLSISAPTYTAESLAQCYAFLSVARHAGSIVALMPAPVLKRIIDHVRERIRPLALPNDPVCNFVQTCIETPDLEKGKQIAAFINSATPQPLPHALHKATEWDIIPESWGTARTRDSWFFYTSGFCLYRSELGHACGNRMEYAIGVFTVQGESIVVSRWKKLKKPIQAEVYFEDTSIRRLFAISALSTYTF